MWWNPLNKNKLISWSLIFILDSNIILFIVQIEFYPFSKKILTDTFSLSPQAHTHTHTHTLFQMTTLAHSHHQTYTPSDIHTLTLSPVYLACTHSNANPHFHLLLDPPGSDSPLSPITHALLRWRWVAGIYLSSQPGTICLDLTCLATCLPGRLFLLLCFFLFLTI